MRVHKNRDITRKFLTILSLFLFCFIVSPKSFVSEPQALKNPWTGYYKVYAAEPKVEPKTEREEILDYIREVFGKHSDEAIAIVTKCENKALNPRAVNHNRNGSRDLGLFQLNDKYWGGEENFDYRLNTRKAYQIFLRANKKWTPWTCAWVVNQKSFLNNDQE